MSKLGSYVYMTALVAAPIFAHYGGLDWHIGVAISLWLIVRNLGSSDD